MQQIVSLNFNGICTKCCKACFSCSQNMPLKVTDKIIHIKAECRNEHWQLDLVDMIEFADKINKYRG